MKELLWRIALVSALCSLALTLGAQTKPSPVQHGVVLLPGTQLSVRLAESLDTRHDRPGKRFTANLSSAVMDNGTVVLPRGAVCRGHLTESKPSGRLRGRAVIGLTLDSVELNGTTYRVTTSSTARVSKSHKKRNLLFIGGIASAGAAIGGAAAGGVGALIGGGAGAGAGTAGAAITGKRNVHLAPETRFTFSLREPVTIRV